MFIRWVLKVSSSRSISVNIARIVACAAFLACSLFGRTLHDLHHTLEDARPVTSAHSCSCHSHSACQSTAASPVSGSPEKAPKPSHDSHSCAICYALCISATSAESVTVSLDPRVAAWRFVVPDETIVPRHLHSDEARGPPHVA